MIEVEAARTMLARDLPEHARWILEGATWDWDFSRARSPLTTPRQHEILVPVPAECPTAERFVATWRVFDTALGRDAPAAPNGRDPMDRLRALDPGAREASEWRLVALASESP